MSVVHNTWPRRNQTRNPLPSVYAPMTDDQPLHSLEYSTGQDPLAVNERDDKRRRTVRLVALLCACSLSIGSHYATYILGPLKTRLSRELGTSNTEFSLLIAAFSLNSTWTPLLGGLLAARFGTTMTSILATSLIFLGQAVLLFGDKVESVRLMTLGMFIFGLGVSPLSVVQESIIVRFFKHHGLGLSMAFGLVVGKVSSFLSARTSYPLSEYFGPRAPFIVATTLAFFSFVMNLIYLAVSKWLVRTSGAELEASELREEAQAVQVESLSEAQALRQVAEKKRVHLRDITKLGDVFWAYIGINVLCGAIWTPFTHLAPNIIQQRYGLSEIDASNKASFLLAGSIFLYPIVGSVVDRYKGKPILQILLVTSSVLTFMCYFWLWLPPSVTGTPVPSIAAFCIGQGFAPLLLVVIVPTLVSSKYVPTTLGTHKSLEQTGTTIFQTFAGLYLDKHSPQQGSSPTGPNKATDKLLQLFLCLNILQFVGIVGLWTLDRRRKRQARYTALIAHSTDPSSDDQLDDDEETPKTSRSNRLSLSGSRRISESHSLHRWEHAFETLPGVSGAAHDSDTIPGTAEGLEEERPLLREEAQHGTSASLPSKEEEPEFGVAQSRGEILRGEIFSVLGICAILFAWVFFIVTALHRLRSRGDRKDE